MRNFSQIISESVNNHDSVSLLQSEITSYINKVKKVLPRNIEDLIRLTEKYNLTNRADIDFIKQSNKGQIKNLAEKYNIPIPAMETIYSLVKQAGRNIRLLPQYQTESERAAIEAGALATSDLTIDLTTSTGRNAAAKMYTPIVLKIVSQYVGKSKLDRASLISAGMEGLTKAMDEWDGKKSTFKTYCSYRIQQAILDEINANSHDLSGTNWYAAEKYGAAALDAVSVDGVSRDDNDDDDFKQDRLIGLSVDPVDFENDVTHEEHHWKDIFKMLDAKFSTRDMDIFYRYFGLGTYHGKRQKSKDIAREYGMSEGNIRNSIINKIIKFLQTNEKANQIMASIKDMYTESLLAELFNTDKETIREELYKDLTFIMLEEVTRWDNKDALMHAVNNACDKLSIDDAKVIYYCMTNGIEYFNSNLRKNKKLIVWFLSELYPTVSMNRKSNEELANYMTELIDATKKLKIDW